MRKQTVIRGKPIYLYKKSQYLEKPEGCVVYKIRYDEETNYSYLYCKKRSVIIELVCSLIILACCYCTIFGILSSSQGVLYNSMVHYYNGELYLNITNCDYSEAPVKVSLYDEDTLVYQEVLEPGSAIISIPIENVCDKYIIKFSYKMLLRTISDEETINVIKHDEIQGD